MIKDIYLDNSATTQIDERAFNSMVPYFKSSYANPASTHFLGSQIKRDIDQARQVISEFLNCHFTELIFTSGATESLNIAIKGIALGDNTNKNKLVTIKSEHKAVLDNFNYLESIGFEIVYLDVDHTGQINLEELKTSVDRNTIAVCAMLVNNETGTYQRIKEIAVICHQNDAFLICDGTQAVGKIPVDVHELGVDVLVFSAHKFHGPKGIGGLYLQKRVVLAPLLHGGGQESGLRSGTMNVPGIVGLAKACQIATNEMKINQEHILSLRNKLELALLSIPGTKLNGHPSYRCHHISNISFPDIDANVFIRETPQFSCFEWLSVYICLTRAISCPFSHGAKS